MKNDINIGDKVVFLYCQHLETGMCTKVNGKTYKIHVPASGCTIEYTKNVQKDRVANINDEFTVVWECDRGVEGAYRIDYTTYPTENKNYTNWNQPYKYITEKL